GGQTVRDDHQEAGVNSRLDELQAAVLGARLPLLRGWTDRRRALAAQYRAALNGSAVGVPAECDDGHVYHLFVVRTAQRAALRAHLEAEGIETLVHYPVPLPQQLAMAPFDPAECPVAACVCREIVSLPLYPHMHDDEV